MWDDNRFDLHAPNWDYRIVRMLSYLRGYKHGFIESYMDCGAGGQHLKDFLGAEISYIPVDRTNKWGDNVRIIDFNKGEFCKEYVDCVFLSGILEYINNPSEFITNVCRYSNKIVLLSYNTTNSISKIDERESRGWNCHLSKDEIEKLFSENGFRSRVIDDSIYNGVMVETYFLFENENLSEELFDEAVIRSGLKINVGCGTDRRDGFLGLDGSSYVKPDICIEINADSIRRIFKDDTVDYFLVKDFLEHFFHWEAVDMLGAFFSVMKRNGICEIHVPNVERIINDTELSINEKLLLLYGGQEMGRGHSWNVEQDLNRQERPDYFCHKYGWTKQLLKKCLSDVGFSSIKISEEYNNLIVLAEK